MNPSLSTYLHVQTRIYRLIHIKYIYTSLNIYIYKFTKNSLSIQIGIHVLTDTYTYLYMYILINIFTYVYLLINHRVHTYIHKFPYLNVNLHTCSSIIRSVCICKLHIFTYAHIQRHIKNYSQIIRSVTLRLSSRAFSRKQPLPLLEFNFK